MPIQDNSTPLIDLSYLLELGKNNRAFVGMMLKSFRDTAEEHVAEMEKALPVSDWEKTARLLHKMKFALNVIGAKSLEEEMKWLEARTRHPEDTYAEQLPERLAVFISSIKLLQSQVNGLIASGEWQ